MITALTLAAKTPTRLFLGVERSVCGRAWRDRLDERATARALAIAQRHNVPELLARILAGRGVEVDEVEAFLDPTVRRLMPDPHTVTAMEQAALRIADAMMIAEPVAIFGDYDVDGATASALLARFLRSGGTEPVVHIPDRIFEGYGPNVEAIRGLAERGATLLVTVDCGTASFEPLAEARKLGLDVIVLDHHQADERLPDAIVVNPNRLDDLSGLGHLAAVGIVFLTVVAVNRILRARGFWAPTRPEPDLLGWLDIVALGTVADVVPLRGENRALVHKGLKILNNPSRVGIRELILKANLKLGAIDSSAIGFGLGPRLNASGRMDHARLSYDLLMTSGFDHPSANILIGAAHRVCHCRQRQVMLLQAQGVDIHLVLLECSADGGDLSYTVDAGQGITQTEILERAQLG